MDRLGVVSLHLWLIKEVQDDLRVDHISFQQGIDEIRVLRRMLLAEALDHAVEHVDFVVKMLAREGAQLFRGYVGVCSHTAIVVPRIENTRPNRAA